METFHELDSHAPGNLSEAVESALDHAGQILENLPVGVAVHHRHGIVYANAAAGQIIGHDNPQGLHLLDLFKGEARDVASGLLDAAFREKRTSGETLELFGAMVRSPGEVPGAHYDRSEEKVGAIFVHVTVAPLNWSDNASVQVILQDVTEEHQSKLRLERLAYTDGLTGLLNRRSFTELGTVEIRRAKRHQRPLALLMIDIDHFKKVNDTYGHHCGDDVIRALAGCCRSHLRKSDLIGRIGGEEFVAFLPETELRGAAGLAERLRKAIAESIVETDGNKIRYTISVGVAVLSAADDGLETLLERSDVALYRAKNCGRNCVRTENDLDPAST